MRPAGASDAARAMFPSGSRFVVSKTSTVSFSCDRRPSARARRIVQDEAEDRRADDSVLKHDQDRRDARRGEVQGRCGDRVVGRQGEPCRTEERDHDDRGEDEQPDVEPGSGPAHGLRVRPGSESRAGPPRPRALRPNDRRGDRRTSTSRACTGRRESPSSGGPPSPGTAAACGGLSARSSAIWPAATTATAAAIRSWGSSPASRSRTVGQAGHRAERAFGKPG